MENKEQAKSTPGNEVMVMFKKIQELKLRVEKSEKPCWQTNRMFRYSDSSAHGATDIGTVTDPRKLIEMLAFLKDRESSYNSAAAELGLESKTFKWLNFSVEEWKSDFSTRVEQLRVSETKKTLALAEQKLAAVLSPEMKQQLEMEAVSQMLEDLKL
jgi:hypothetical protein